MKKKLISLLLALVMTFACVAVLGSCGDDSGPTGCVHYDDNKDGKCDDCEVILQDYEEQLKEEQKEPEDQNPEPEQKDPVKKADKSKGIPWWAVALMAVFCGAIAVLASLLILKKLKQNKA
jgi:RsiW-degrading membrane proteinase PrsW (M82 family)